MSRWWAERTLRSVKWCAISARAASGSPQGFATTSHAYWQFVEMNRFADGMASALRRFESGKASLSETGEAIRRAFLQGELPTDIEDAIRSAYAELCDRAGRADVDVAVRSSATAEDLPDASFAGQQETFLNIRGEAALLAACRRCFASLFTDRAISYRQAKGFDHMKIALSVGVQLMVRSDLGGAGVMFTIDTETGFDKVVVIDAAWGLGERRAGRRRSRRVSGVQTAAGEPGTRADHREAARRQGAKDDLCEHRRAGDPQRADLAGRTRSLRAGRRGHPFARPLGLRH